MHENRRHCKQISVAVKTEIEAKKRGETVETKEETTTTSKNSWIIAILAAMVLGLMGVNLAIQFGLQQKMGQMPNAMSLLAIGAQNPAGSSEKPAAQPSPSPESQREIQALMAEMIPRGTPEGYGSELGVSFEKPVESMAILAAFDGDLYPNGTHKFEGLSETQKQRYVQIGQSISCEFCCGATYMVAPNGKPACGCAHSAAMRGLAMHLLINSENEYSNDEILAELTKWKTMFFPKQMIQKAIDLKAKNGEISPNALNQLPEMVGGC
ncbi:MAG: hypothetical protein HYW50_04795 [Candidatus Diapherotrites archaeon]|nr:hypothetical protein [Candidatus Diapherotrites archaeon]